MRVKEAFGEGFNGQFVGENGSLTSVVSGAADEARKQAQAFSTLGDAMFSSANEAIPAWERIKELLKDSNGDFDIRNVLGTDSDEDLGLDEKVRSEFEKIEDLAPPIIPAPDTEPFNTKVTESVDIVKELGETLEDSLKENLKGLIKGTTSFRDALSNVLDEIADKLLDFALDNLIGGLGGLFGGGGGGGLFSSALSGLCLLYTSDAADE